MSPCLPNLPNLHFYDSIDALTPPPGTRANIHVLNVNSLTPSSHHCRLVIWFGKPETLVDTGFLIVLPWFLNVLSCGQVYGCFRQVNLLEVAG
jgi:hypothetical protein